MDIPKDIASLNKNDAWKILYAELADYFVLNNIPIDNIFFANTPAFVVLTSEIDKAIMNDAAINYTTLIMRSVLVEKFQQKHAKFIRYFDREPIPGDKMKATPVHTMSYRLNWNESIYGHEFDLIKALKTFIKSKSHCALFLYVEIDFLENLQLTKIIRVATITSPII